MEDKKRKTYQIIMLLVSFLISLLLIFYFFVIHTNFAKKIDLWVMILALVYIIFELIKKNLIKLVSAWNRIYYLGLFAIIAPVALENRVSIEALKWINHIGIFFLLLPLILEARLLIKSQKS